MCFSFCLELYLNIVNNYVYDTHYHVTNRIFYFSIEYKIEHEFLVQLCKDGCYKYHHFKTKENADFRL